MNNFEFEIDNTLNLMLDIMALTNFYRQKFFNIEIQLISPSLVKYNQLAKPT